MNTDCLSCVVDVIQLHHNCNRNTAMALVHKLKIPGVEQHTITSRPVKMAPLKDILEALNEDTMHSELLEALRITYPSITISQVLVHELWQKYNDICSVVKEFETFARLQTKFNRQKPRVRGKRRLSAPDVTQILQRHFGDKLVAKCNVCDNYVTAARVVISFPDTYTPGDLQGTTVVCPCHTDSPPYYPVSANPRLVACWLLRVGPNLSKSTCAICGQCPLSFWGSCTEVCHIEPTALGGTLDLDNLVIGSAMCNRQQGDQPLSEFQKRIGTVGIHCIAFKKEFIRQSAKEFMTTNKKKLRVDPLKRISCVLHGCDVPISYLWA